MNAPDPFALGGHPDPEIIVDEEEKAALALLAREPVLGPLARRAFEADELYGNGNPRHPLYEEWCRDARRLDRELDATRAETIGGIAWRLDMLCRFARYEADFSEYIGEMLRLVCEDAKRLALADIAAEGGRAKSRTG